MCVLTLCMSLYLDFLTLKSINLAIHKYLINMNKCIIFFLVKENIVICNCQSKMNSKKCSFKYNRTWSINLA